MAGTYWRRARDLRHELTHNTPAFGFFQATRLLGLMTPGNDKGVPHNLRFRSRASLSFAASELTTFRESPDEHAPHELTVNFMGLTGPSGVLPTGYTELVMERWQRHRDTGLHAFLDIFSHRTTALFFQAWRKYRVWAAVEAGEPDGLTRNVLDLSGMGLTHLRGALTEGTVPDESVFLHYAGLLSQRPLSAQSLACLIEGFFGIKARLEQFVGKWMDIPPTDQSQLGHPSAQLGTTALCGQRTWDRQTTVRLHLGPLPRAQFDALQPGAPGAQTLTALMNFALGHSLGVEVTLTLRRDDVPAAQLTAPDDNPPPRLGHNLWLGTPARDPDDRRYTLLH